MAYAAAYSIPEARATMLLPDGLTSVPCVCTSVKLARASTDEGQIEEPVCFVRMIDSGYDEMGLDIGKVVTITTYDGRANTLRIIEESPVAGMITLTMGAVNG